MKGLSNASRKRLEVTFVGFQDFKETLASSLFLYLGFSRSFFVKFTLSLEPFFIALYGCLERAS
jgi:hypothetical protein